MNFRKNWGWFIVTTFSLLASWHYFFGTPHVLGLDYFIHLTQADIIKQGISDGIPIPAYHYLHGAGTTFIRYQGMLIAQMMGWCCYILQIFVDVSDTTVIMFVGRLFGILLNLAAGLAFFWSARKIISTYTEEENEMDSAAVVATSAYIFGWSRWGVVLHVGSLQRAGALIFFPIAFSILLTLLKRPLNKKEQIIMALSTSCCVMCHPGSFIYLITLCLICAITATIINYREQLQFAKWKTIIVPAIISMCLASWFLVPMILERDYYGMMQRQKETENIVGWGETLSAKYAAEFVNRDSWFSNLDTNPDKGGSFLAGFGGVNSAYFGISTLLVAFFGITLLTKPGPMRKISIITNTTAFIIFIIIFWKGVRHNVFHSIGHHLTLPFYWLEPFYFSVCICTLFGAISILKKLKRLTKKSTTVAIMIGISCVIAIDFTSLTLKTKAAEMYKPQIAQQDPIGISGNNSSFDSYEILQNVPAGRVLDLPKLLFNCNRLYHGLPDALPEEPNTDWTEAKFYTEQVAQKEVLKAIPFSLEYGTREPLPIVEAKSAPMQQSNSKYLWQSQKAAQAELELKINLPMGKFNSWVVIPSYLPSQTKIEAYHQEKLVTSVETKEKSYHYYFIIPINKTNVKKEIAKLVLKINKKSDNEKLTIGVEQPFIAYAGKALAYRLSILNIRYIVLNLRHFKPATGQTANSKFIRKLYQSQSSVLYENVLSSPCILPKKAFRIESQRPWELFSKISRHPNFNPNKVSFYYANKNIKETVNEENWQEKLVPLFLQETKENKVNCQVVHNNLESISYKINNIYAENHLFISLHYHPNLRAFVNDKETDMFIAQAGTIAIEIPKGECEIRIEYSHPWYDVTSKWLSLITAILLIIYIVAGRKKKAEKL